MRVVQKIEILPPLRASDRTRQRNGGAVARHEGGRRSGSRFVPAEIDVVSAPHGTPTFVTQQIAQEWLAPAAPDADRASSAYRRETARRRRDLLPRT